MYMKNTATFCWCLYFRSSNVSVFVSFQKSLLLWQKISCSPNCYVKLSVNASAPPEQDVSLQQTREALHQAHITIKSFPNSHIYGKGCGVDESSAYQAAIRDIVQRLYDFGLLTPILYYSIGIMHQKYIFLNLNWFFECFICWKNFASAAIPCL